MQTQLDGKMKASQIPDFPVSLWKKIGGRAATRIVKNADKGLDRKGKKFKKYKESYENLKKEGKAAPKGVSASRQISPPNLRLTSTMLNSISAQDASKTGVSIIFRDALKVEGNKKRGRDIVGLSPDNLNQAQKTLTDFIGKNIEKYESKPITIKVG